MPRGPWLIIIVNLTHFYDRVLRDTAVARSSTHGPRHWARVERNALYLSEHTNADPKILRLFAVLHDSMRENDYEDPFHGQRAAEYAATIRFELFDLSDSDFELLDYSIRWHTNGDDAPNDTVAACWDSDRLDLRRVGIMPDPHRLFTPEAKRIASEGAYDCLDTYTPNGLADHPWD